MRRRSGGRRGLPCHFRDGRAGVGLAYELSFRRDPASGDFCAAVLDAWASGNNADAPRTAAGASPARTACWAPSGFSWPTRWAKTPTGLPTCKPDGRVRLHDGVRSHVAAPLHDERNVNRHGARGEQQRGAVVSRPHLHGTARRRLPQHRLVAGGIHVGPAEPQRPAGGVRQLRPPRTVLCLPHACDVYTVAANDTCWGIAEGRNGSFTVSQLVAWNADISWSCW